MKPKYVMARWGTLTEKKQAFVKRLRASWRTLTPTLLTELVLECSCEWCTLSRNNRVPIKGRSDDKRPLTHPRDKRAHYVAHRCPNLFPFIVFFRAHSPLS